MFCVTIWEEAAARQREMERKQKEMKEQVPIRNFFHFLLVILYLFIYTDVDGIKLLYCFVRGNAQRSSCFSIWRPSVSSWCSALTPIKTASRRAITIFHRRGSACGLQRKNSLPGTPKGQLVLQTPHRSVLRLLSCWVFEPRTLSVPTKLQVLPGPVESRCL